FYCIRADTTRVSADRSLCPQRCQRWANLSRWIKDRVRCERNHPRSRANGFTVVDCAGCRRRTEATYDRRSKRIDPTLVARRKFYRVLFQPRQPRWIVGSAGLNPGGRRAEALNLYLSNQFLSREIWRELHLVARLQTDRVSIFNRSVK